MSTLYSRIKALVADEACPIEDRVLAALLWRMTAEASRRGETITALRCRKALERIVSQAAAGEVAA